MTSAAALSTEIVVNLDTCTSAIRANDLQAGVLGAVDYMASLHEEVDAYFRREVLPHAPDAWIDAEKTKVGYEIPFNRHFYVFEAPRPLAEIDTDLREVTVRIQYMLKELAA